MKFWFGPLVILLMTLAPASASFGAPITAIFEQQIEALLVPGRDFLDVKLEVDAIIDASVPIAESKKQIDELTSSSAGNGQEHQV